MPPEHGMKSSCCHPSAVPPPFARHHVLHLSPLYESFRFHALHAHSLCSSPSCPQPSLAHLFPFFARQRHLRHSCSHLAYRVVRQCLLYDYYPWLSPYSYSAANITLFLKNVIRKSKKRNKLAGCDFGKLLNIMVLQKCAPAKSHEKTWELAGWFSGMKLCNRLRTNE